MAAARKAARKSGHKSGRFKTGRDKRRGRGPTKGAANAGRPPDWLKAFCDSALADQRTRKVVTEILHDSEHPAVVAMWKAVADRAHGRPMQSMKLDISRTFEDTLDELDDADDATS
jgi:hypothetical protein